MMISSDTCPHLCMKEEQPNGQRTVGIKYLLQMSRRVGNMKVEIASFHSLRSVDLSTKKGLGNSMGDSVVFLFPFKKRFDPPVSPLHWYKLPNQFP